MQHPKRNWQYSFQAPLSLVKWIERRVQTEWYRRVQLLLLGNMQSRAWQSNHTTERVFMRNKQRRDVAAHGAIRKMTCPKWWSIITLYHQIAIVYLYKPKKIVQKLQLVSPFFGHTFFIKWTSSVSRPRYELKKLSVMNDALRTSCLPGFRMVRINLSFWFYPFHFFFSSFPSFYPIGIRVRHFRCEAR